MLEEILSLLRASAKTLEGSPVADQALADVRSVEEVAAKHVKAAEEDVKNWLIARLHPVFGSEAPPAA